MQENSYNQIKDYFQDLVENSNFLNDFVGFFQREWAERTASVDGLNSPYLALFRYEIGLEGPDNNTKAVRRIGLAVMYDNIAADDLEAQYGAIHNAEALAMKVLSRIRYDSYQPDHFLYNAFRKESVEINTVELSANDFGVEVFLNLDNKQKLFVNPEDWKDIDKIC